MTPYLPLSSVAKVVMGQSPPSASFNDQGDGPPFFQGKADFNSLYPTIRKYSTAGTRLAEADDILLSVRAPVGPTNLAPTQCVLGRGLAGIRALPGVDQRYLLWAIRATADSLAAQGTGSTFSAVTGVKVRAHSVPIVGDEVEQRRIVEIIEDHLSRLEAGVGYIDKNLMRASLMRRAAWEQRFASGSKLVPMASLVEKTEAGKSVGGAAPAARPGRWGIIKVSAMTWGEFRPQENKEIPDVLVDERFRIRLGDLLVSRANTSELVGASVLVQVPPERLLLSDKSVRVVPRSEVLAEWLWRALSAPSTRKQMSAKATGTKDSMRNISQQALLHIMVPDPSERDQAADIQWARELDIGVTRLQDQLGAQRGRASSLRRAVLAAAFSGRLTGAASDGDLIEETAETLEGER